MPSSRACGKKGDCPPPTLLKPRISCKVEGDSPLFCHRLLTSEPETHMRSAIAEAVTGIGVIVILPVIGITVAVIRRNIVARIRRVVPSPAIGVLVLSWVVVTPSGVVVSMMVGLR